MKRFFAVMTVLAVVAALCGCSGETASSESSSDETITHEIQSQETIYGKVDSIVGNEVTIELGTPEEGTAPQQADNGASSETSESASSESASPSDGGSAPQGGGSMPSGGAPQGNMSMPDSASMPDGASMPEGGSMPSGGMPSGGTGGDTNGGGAGRSVTLTYTGETASYILPVGMSVGTGDYSSISSGMVISITTATFEDGSEAIISCSILSK